MNRDNTQEKPISKDMSHVWAGRRASAARARADKARAELEMQGYLVVAEPDESLRELTPEELNAWGRGYHAGWKQGYADGTAG